MRWPGFALAAACLFGVLAAGCFNPDRPACAFSCIAPPHICPSGFTCGPDNLCHDPTSRAICGLDLTDATASDDATEAHDADADVAVDTPTDSSGQ